MPCHSCHVGISISYKFYRNNLLCESLKIFNPWFKTNLNCAIVYHLIKKIIIHFLHFLFENSNLIDIIWIFDDWSNIQLLDVQHSPSIGVIFRLIFKYIRVVSDHKAGHEAACDPIVNFLQNKPVVSKIWIKSGTLSCLNTHPHNNLKSIPRDSG